MEETKYLIIGSSHAGLTAAEEIRIHDPAGSMTMVTMETCLPYSPTVLPYIVSGKVEEKQIYLRDKDYFKANDIVFKTGKKLSKVDVKKSVATLCDGSKIGYKKLLIATGSEPTLPPTPGLEGIGLSGIADDGRCAPDQRGGEEGEECGDHGYGPGGDARGGRTAGEGSGRGSDPWAATGGIAELL